MKSSLHICQTYHLSGILFVQVFTWVPDRQGQANLPENKKTKQSKQTLETPKRQIKPIPGEDSQEIVLCTRKPLGKPKKQNKQKNTKEQPKKH